LKGVDNDIKGFKEDFSNIHDIGDKFKKDS
jgi:hypothetical protein